ncbi:pathogen- protein [Haplosporangium gracile]|nr:pathogen- protein [Haplosporangium gracile]
MELVASLAWYDEVSKYNFDSPGFYYVTGHFTQVVWKVTKSIGCAKRSCSRWAVYICNYDPPGNIVSWDNAYFRDNISSRL